MIEIPNNLSVEKIDDLYLKLIECDKDEKIDIKLPKEIKNSEFGLLFSLLQFIATWIRLDNSGDLHLSVAEDDVSSYLINNEFVYPIVVICWEKSILDHNGSNVKKAFKKPSRDYFEKMDYFDLKMLYNVPIYCFDFDKSNRGLAKSLYIDKENMYSEDGLGFNLYPAYQKIGDFNKTIFRQSITESLDSITAIIHELFLNTHEHAKTDEEGNYLYPNIRAIQLKFHKKKIQTLRNEFKSFKGLKHYFESTFQLNDQDELYLIEISILDSGPGLVKRYAEISDLSTITTAQEVDYIKQCLHRHNTSSDISISDTKGIGLDRVLRTLDDKGFIRIKTGRVDVVRDVKINKYVYEESPSKIKIFDRKTNSNNEFEEHPNSAGTLISIFYPLNA